MFLPEESVKRGGLFKNSERPRLCNAIGLGELKEITNIRRGRTSVWATPKLDDYATSESGDELERRDYAQPVYLQRIGRRNAESAYSERKGVRTSVQTVSPRCVCMCALLDGTGASSSICCRSSMCMCFPDTDITPASERSRSTRENVSGVKLSREAIKFLLASSSTVSASFCSQGWKCYGS